MQVAVHDLAWAQGDTALAQRRSPGGHGDGPIAGLVVVWVGVGKRHSRVPENLHHHQVVRLDHGRVNLATRWHQQQIHPGMPLQRGIECLCQGAQRGQPSPGIAHLQGRRAFTHGCQGQAALYSQGIAEAVRRAGLAACTSSNSAGHGAGGEGILVVVVLAVVMLVVAARLQIDGVVVLIQHHHGSGWQINPVEQGIKHRRTGQVLKKCRVSKRWQGQGGQGVQPRC